MKSILFALMFVAVTVAACAETITLTDGRSFAEAKIVSETPMRVTLRHSGGLTQVDKAALPEALRVKYPADPVAAERDRAREEARAAAAAAEYERSRPQREARAKQLAKDREKSAAHRDSLAAEERNRAESQQAGLFKLARREAENYFETQWRPGNNSVHVTRVIVDIESVEPAAGWPGQYNVVGSGYVAYYMSQGSSFSSNANLRFTGVIQNGRMTVTLR